MLKMCQKVQDSDDGHNSRLSYHPGSEDQTATSWFRHLTSAANHDLSPPTVERSSPRRLQPFPLSDRCCCCCSHPQELHNVSEFMVLLSNTDKNTQTPTQPTHLRVDGRALAKQCSMLVLCLSPAGPNLPVP